MRTYITSLTRKGVIDKAGTTETFGLLDKLTIGYSGNRISWANASTDALPFEGMTGVGLNGVGIPFTYDASGRLNCDDLRGIESIEYDNDGHPVRIVLTSGNEQRDVWDGLGNHLATEYYTPQSMGGKEPYITKSYGGDGQVEYRLGPDIGIPNNKVLQYTQFPGGYFDQNGAPHYYISDYQGNNTAVIDSAARIISETGYYPYGDPWREIKDNPFTFSGNERLLYDGLNEYDFNARRYYAALPAFSSWDALNEQYPWLSPYAYCAGNPINMTDKYGLRMWHRIEDEDYEYYERDGVWGFYNEQGVKYEGYSQMLEGLDEIRSANSLGEKMITSLVKSDRSVHLNYTDEEHDENSFYGAKGRGPLNLYWDPYNYVGGIGLNSKVEIDIVRSEVAGLAHELGHAYDYILPQSIVKACLTTLHNNIDINEVIPCIIENSIRTVLGDPIRQSYLSIGGDGYKYIDEKTLLRYSQIDYILMILIDN